MTYVELNIISDKCWEMYSLKISSITLLSSCVQRHNNEKSSAEVRVVQNVLQIYELVSTKTQLISYLGHDKQESIPLLSEDKTGRSQNDKKEITGKSSDDITEDRSIRSIKCFLLTLNDNSERQVN